MKILLVDDEPPARARLRHLLHEIDPALEIVGDAIDGAEALRLTMEELPDVVLLDIRLPRQNGVDAALDLSRLPKPPAVIFVTAHEDHAVQAFEVNAVDYLLKPVRRERLASALQRARRWLGAGGAATEPRRVQQDQQRSHLCSHSHSGMRLVPVAECRYFRADQKYTSARTLTGEFLIEEPLKALEEEFGERLIRVHRSALAAVEHIVALQRSSVGGAKIRFEGIDDTLAVSRRHMSAVRSRLRLLAE